MEFFTIIGYCICCILVLSGIYGLSFFMSYAISDDDEGSAIMSAISLIIIVSIYITMTWGKQNFIYNTVSDNNIEMEVGEDEGNASMDHIFDNDYCYNYYSNN